MKILSRLVNKGGLKIDVRFEASPKDGVTDQQVEEIKTALRSLGMNENIEQK